MTESDYLALVARKKGAKPPAGKLTKQGRYVSVPEERLAWQLTGAGIKYLRNFRFHLRRKWEADFLILPLPRRDALIVEVEGRGRHQTIQGFESDAEKYAEAMMLGYQVLRVTPRQIAKEKAIGWIKKLTGRTP